MLSLKEQLKTRKEKVNYFREEQAITVDLEQKFSVKKKIEEEEIEISKLETEIENLEKREFTKNGNVPIVTIADAFKLKAEFNSKTTKEDIKNVSDLAILAEKEIFGNLFKEIRNNSVAAAHYYQTLFEEIAFAEKLEIKTIGDIYRVRNEENSETSDTLKKLIVSALTLSILNFKKIDKEKLNILNNFVNDDEDGIWERALVGIYLGLKLHENRLERFQIKINTFSNLRSAEKIQASLLLIDQVMQREFYKNVIEIGSFYEAPFLQDASNWFLPFTDKEPKIKDVMTNSEIEIEENAFRFFLFRIPFLDCVKFSICEGLINGNVNVEIKQKIRNYQSYLFNDNIGDIANGFHPYYQIISTLYLYDKYFSKEDKNKIFQERNSIANTSLKGYLLNDKVMLKLKAEDDFTNKKFQYCIDKLIKLVELEPDDYNSLLMIADCYFNIGKYSLAINCYQKVQDKFEDSLKIKYKIAYCLVNLRLYDDAIELYLEIKKSQPMERDNLNKLIECYIEIDDFGKAIEILKEIEVNTKLNYYELTQMAMCFESMQDIGNMVKYVDEAYEMDPENPISIINKAALNLKLGEKDEAEILFENAYQKANNDLTILSMVFIGLIEINKNKADFYFKKINTNIRLPFLVEYNIFKYYLVESDDKNALKIGKKIYQTQNYKFEFLANYTNLLLKHDYLKEVLDASEIFVTKQPGIGKKQKGCLDIANIFLFLGEIENALEYFKKAACLYTKFEDFKNLIEAIIANNDSNLEFRERLMSIKENIFEDWHKEHQKMLKPFTPHE